MIKLNVWYERDGETCLTTLRCLRPRRYMCGWSFERVLAYAKEELWWADIQPTEVTSFEFVNDTERWVQPIASPTRR